MPAPNIISPEKLARLIGTPAAPVIVDLRGPGARDALPGSVPRDPQQWRDWSATLAGRSAVLVDATSGDAPALAALLRSQGAPAEALEGGIAAWQQAGLPLVQLDHLPPRKGDGRTWWVTRARPKVDRIACPWLIRRFVDPEARFLFVPPGDVLAVAERLEAEPFDVSADGVFWSHRGERCTFDVMVETFGLMNHAPLAHLAVIVRGADTDRADIAPEASGLLAVSLGLSRMFDDDHTQLEAGMLVYDALYRWCRDARDETHNWASHRPSRAKAAL